MGAPLGLGKKQVLPCVIISFGVWLSHLRFSILASTGRSFGTKTGVLANVSSDGYDDLERVPLLQRTCQLPELWAAVPGETKL